MAPIVSTSRGERPDRADLEDFRTSVGLKRHTGRGRGQGHLKPPPGRVELLAAHYALVCRRARAYLSAQGKATRARYAGHADKTSVLEMISADEGDLLIAQIEREQRNASVYRSGEVETA